jgi:rare lipoprotein A
MRRDLLPVATALALVLAGCATSHPRRGEAERGIASWYGPGFHGRFTASGELYDMNAMTAAHPTLPLGTIVEVHNLENDRSVRVKINDRGPFKKNRILDLSRAAAEALGMIGPGTALVEVVPVGIVPIGGTSFAVQVGAFLDIASADRLAEELRSSYPGVSVRSDDVWNRVQVGQFSNRESAETIAAQLRRAGYSALVVPTADLDPGS